MKKIIEIIFITLFSLCMLNINAYTSGPTLKSITITTDKIDTTFQIEEYNTINFNTNSTSITIEAECNDSSATVEGIGRQTIPVSDTTFILTVTAREGTNYYYVLIKHPSRDATSITDMKPSQVFIENNTLHIYTNVKEKIGVYNVTGNLLYRIQKPLGKFITPSPSGESVLIIHGSSGWVKRVINTSKLY